MKVIVQIILFIFPWKIRRKLLIKFFGYQISKSARIGYSIIKSKKLVMYENAYISNFTYCNTIDALVLKEYARLGTFNYITGFPTHMKSSFSHIENRKCELVIGKHSAITSRHFLDTTAGIYIGNYSTFAGIRSQILTHSIDLKMNRQDAESVVIADYCFIGTGCIILKGSYLPSYSILGAGSMLNKKFHEENGLYGGVAAKLISKISIEDHKYFQRNIGSVK